MLINTFGGGGGGGGDNLACHNKNKSIKINNHTRALESTTPVLLISVMIQ